jgi:small subunit ribosomal protein S19e
MRCDRFEMFFHDNFFFFFFFFFFFIVSLEMATRETVQVFGVKDVKSEKFVAEFAKYLKRSGKIELPKYVDFVKTGHAKELSPYNADWYYIRAAALARRVYCRPGTGVGGFRKTYSVGFRDGNTPEHQALASGAIIRTILQQLEKMGLVEKDPQGGRRMTQQGRRDLDRVASIVLQKKRLGQ